MVAFTGGNGPALTAYLLNNLFDGSVVGCIGDTSRLPREQVEHASFVADLLGRNTPQAQDVASSAMHSPSMLKVGSSNVLKVLWFDTKPCTGPSSICGHAL